MTRQSGQLRDLSVGRDAPPWDSAHHGINARIGRIRSLGCSRHASKATVARTSEEGWSAGCLAAAYPDARYPAAVLALRVCPASGQLYRVSAGVYPASARVYRVAVRPCRAKAG